MKFGLPLIALILLFGCSSSTTQESNSAPGGSQAAEPAAATGTLEHPNEIGLNLAAPEKWMMLEPVHGDTEKTLKEWEERYPEAVDRIRKVLPQYQQMAQIHLLGFDMESTDSRFANNFNLIRVPSSAGSLEELAKASVQQLKGVFKVEPTSIMEEYGGVEYAHLSYPMKNEAGSLVVHQYITMHGGDDYNLTFSMTADDEARVLTIAEDVMESVSFVD